jgi:hypothetical protein
MDNSKFFEAALSLAQSLSQWDLLILGGSLVVIVSTSYYRPKNLKVRAAYYLFIPTWLCLAVSLYAGIVVQRHYVAYLVAARPTRPNQPETPEIAKEISEIAAATSDASRFQIYALEAALLFGALWLLIYIVWWIHSNQSGEKS